MCYRVVAFVWLLLLCYGTNAQNILGVAPNVSANSGSNRVPDFYNTVNSYVNPVLPGDHPDPTLLKVGDDFYHCGSSFHFAPYLPIYHSKDLVHWELISRVIQPAAAGWVSDKPSTGIWQGALTYFYGSFWIYFSSGGQWFSKAPSPAGPWSTPVKVATNPLTGPLGYDNSIFIEDDGKPYMIIKNGQKTNRIQALGKDGQLADTVINLDWINGKLQYSWAEGPVMCKRNSYYFYFPAGDVTGGQYVLRSKTLSSDSTKWERLGEFFKPVTDTNSGFRRPNHISAPIQLGDGTWWTIGQSYEKTGEDDWSGTGRQTGLYQVLWEGDRPWGVAPTTAPAEKPALSSGGIPWRSVRSDYFSTDSLSVWWHFLSRTAAAKLSLTARRGWLRLLPDSARAHTVQKETDHYYTAVTKVDFDARGQSEAGLYFTNGNQKVNLRLYSGFADGKKIIFNFDSTVRMISNTFGNTVWLKVQRNEHELSAYCSADGNRWTTVGSISATDLDKTQENYNSWVGTSIGLFAEGAPADFDFFTCKDGFSPLSVAGYANRFGVEKISNQPGKPVTTSSRNGGWLMISGVDLGEDKRVASGIEIIASAITSGTLEIWLDDLATGKLIATIPVAKTQTGEWKTFKKMIPRSSGQHDVFVKFSGGEPGTQLLKSIRFLL